MTPGAKTDRWKVIQDIFQAAVEVPPSERCEYLDRACAGDEELRSEVASLLENDSVDTDTLHSVVASDLKGMAEAASAREIGLRVGPYQLVRELDGGGMGIVYLAVRSDDQYFQIVAIKMVRKGMESPALLQRFRAERQILATLTHPNIGAILDGGETEDGRPYIVMEYVEGQPITHASETRGLSTRQRVELFRSLCSAVQYAHQKLVIHRDIKPSNVLVTSDGIVKLIDFGISKPLAPELIPGELASTESGQRLLTPDYASPEQLLARPLTTATDIYSLGVLLFELLTGARPYTLSDLSPGAAERIVCEQANRKPSSVPEISKQTRNELAGDVDTIVLKAMDKDPSRRYGSAQELDEDLRRVLEGKPILAKPATPLYQLKKFVKRHKTASVIAGVASTVVAAAILFASIQSHAADARVRRIETLADLAVSDMTEKLQQSAVSVELQASLFHSTLNYLNQLKQDSGNDPRLLLKLSHAYHRVGDLEGSPFVANLGNSGTAVASYQEALRLAVEARARMPGDESTRAVIDAYHRLGRMQSYLGNVKDARDDYQQSYPIVRAFLGQRPDDPARKSLLAMNQYGLGEIEFNSRQPDQALKSFRAALDVVGADVNGREDHDQMLLRLYSRIGRTLNELGSQGESLENFRRAVRIAEDLAAKAPGSKTAQRDLFATYQIFVGPLAGIEMLNAGDYKNAQIYARKALDMAEAFAARDRSNAQARDDLAFAYWTVGTSFRSTQPEVAATWYRKSISATEQLSGHGAQQLEAFRDEQLAAVLAGKNQAAERLRILLEANRLRREAANTGPELAEDRLHMGRSNCLLSDAELALGNVSKAREHTDRCRQFLDEFQMSSPSLLVLRDLGYCYRVLGDVQSRIAKDRSLTSAERNAAAAVSRDWYSKAYAVWSEWVKRGAATAESEVERRKVERLLRAQ